MGLHRWLPLTDEFKVWLMMITVNRHFDEMFGHWEHYDS